MPKRVTVYVSPREWGYVEALIDIAEFERKSYESMRLNPAEVSRHDITKPLRPLEDFVEGKLDKTATVSRIIDILERDYGLSRILPSEDERAKVANAVARLVDEVESVKRRNPERVFDFLSSLRYSLIGIARGYVAPRLYEKKESQSS